MKDGYYLSAYLHIDPLDHLLDMNMGRHDQNLALFHKSGSEVRLVRYWEVERLTGMKQHAFSFYDKSHAEQLIGRLLGTCGLSLEDMAEVWGTPQLQTCEDYMPDLSQLTYHSMAHLFSAVMLDTEPFFNGQILGLAVDDSPDTLLDPHARTKPYYSGCVVRHGEIEMFPVSSPGPLWYWAMRRYSLQPGTLMALSAASTSEAYMEPFGTLSVLSDRYDGDVEAFFRALEFIDGLTPADAGTRFNGFDPRFTERENKISMVMKHIQAMSISIMERNVEEILERCRLDASKTVLALAGGYVLNCPTNSHLMRKYGFAGFMAPPCVNDGGISLGMGLYAFYKKMNHASFRFKLESAYAGTTDEELEPLLRSYSPFVHSVEKMDSGQIVKDLIRQPVLWFDAAAEMGPRALGHRSILGDPRDAGTKDALNEIKQREWWRPVAPVMLESELGEWFEDAYPSPFMLHTFTLRGDKRERVPAIAHLDGTARVQTVEAGVNPSLHEVLLSFYEHTGVPMLCNTSLNDKGEPIIDTLEESVNFALRKGIRVAYFNGIRVEFRNHSDYGETEPLTRRVRMNVLNGSEKEAAWKRINPHGIPADLLKYYKLIVERNPDRIYDLTDAVHVKAITKEIRRFKAMYAKQLD
ncbi:carbamoyltransferase C-terminal domain-containing protein [Paenibacillus chitinolyticus]|uniref:carbamoyltransferase C-terminal domain-containing protein n=1 Tax=Paenibacillus chitinolyticus TaxID=79263 RepID=UPI002DBDDC29|nr:carbamoyltransferase C-terminal domain-containing protein [Paenibacillus chitinolyticus]MEC0248502.1 carbamoyltransferase C-terminal domain-containing protein [Paenibacillus chitinolyticus]